MPVFMSLCGLAAGVPWMPTAFKVSPVNDLKTFCLPCSWSYFTDHPIIFIFANSAMLRTVTLLHLHFAVGTALIYAESGSRWTLIPLIFFFHSSLGSFYFHHIVQRIHFCVRFPRSQESESWLHGNRTGRLLLLFASSCFHWLLCFQGHSWPFPITSLWSALILEAEIRDLWAPDFEIPVFPLIPKRQSSQL